MYASLHMYIYIGWLSVKIFFISTSVQVLCIVLQNFENIFVLTDELNNFYVF
jgi:hypothetical protein